MHLVTDLKLFAARIIDMKLGTSPVSFIHSFFICQSFTEIILNARLQGHPKDAKCLLDMDNLKNLTYKLYQWTLTLFLKHSEFEKNKTNFHHLLHLRFRTSLKPSIYVSSM